MSKDRILNNVRIVKRENIWFAERWDGTDWIHVHSSESYEKLVYWLDWNHPHPNIDTRATD